MTQQLIGRRVKLLKESEYYRQAPDITGTITGHEPIGLWVTVVFDNGYSNGYRTNKDLVFLPMGKVVKVNRIQPNKLDE